MRAALSGDDNPNVRRKHLSPNKACRVKSPPPKRPKDPSRQGTDRQDAKPEP